MKCHNLRNMMTPQERLALTPTNALVRYYIATIHETARSANAPRVDFLRVAILSSNLRVLLAEIINRENTPEEMTVEHGEEIDAAFSRAERWLRE